MMIAMVMWLGLMVGQAPAAAPAGTTGICRDGSYSSAASKDGACQGHKGVQTWYAAGASAAKASGAPAAAKDGPAAVATGKTAATGGGPGLVWVNTKSNVYHCYGTTYYGKTKEGSYMSEADAKAKGAHGVRGQGCSK